MAAVESVARIVATLQGWSAAHVAGLLRLAVLHSNHGAAHAHTTCNTPFGAVPVTDRQELREMLHWLRWAMAAYESDTAQLMADLAPQSAGGSSNSSVIAAGADADAGAGADVGVGRSSNRSSVEVQRHVHESAYLKPAFFVALDNERLMVVVSVRGTHAATDVLTDLAVRTCPLLHGRAHAGMLEAAQWIMEQLLDPAIVRIPHGYSIVTTGHSLGAGTAALLALLLEATVPPTHVRHRGWSSVACWAFACPPVLSHTLAFAPQTVRLIRSVVLQDDMVPRLTPEALDDLKAEVEATDWAMALEAPARSVAAAVEAQLGMQQGVLLTSLASGISSLLSTSTSASASTSALPALQSSQSMAVRSSNHSGGSTGASLLSSFASFVRRIDSASSSVPLASAAGQAAAQSSPAHARSVNTLPQPSKSTRLYTPGTLYHIRRYALRPGEKPAVSLQQLLQSERQQQQQHDGSSIDGGGGGCWCEVDAFLREEQAMEARGVATGEAATHSASASPGTGGGGASSMGGGVQKQQHSWLWSGSNSSAATPTDSARKQAAAEPGEWRSFSVGGAVSANTWWGGGAAAASAAAADATSKVSGVNGSRLSGPLLQSMLLQPSCRCIVLRAVPHPSVQNDSSSSVIRRPSGVAGGGLSGNERSNEAWGFTRIRLTPTLLSDHGCKLHGVSMVNAMMWHRDL